LTLSPTATPPTPLDREVSLVDPFEALPASANQDRSPLTDISRSFGRDVLLETKTVHLEPIVHAVVIPSIDESDVALRAPANGRLAIDLVQEFPSSNSLSSGCDIGNRATSNSSLGRPRDTERLQFGSPRVNASRLSSQDHQPNNQEREFHIQLAAISLGKERQAIQVPTDVDLGYVRFREELKEKLIDNGEECIWDALEMQDSSRLWATEEISEGES
jgi:hypothetical protein